MAIIVPNTAHRWRVRIGYVLHHNGLHQRMRTHEHSSITASGYDVRPVQLPMRLVRHWDYNCKCIGVAQARLNDGLRSSLRRRCIVP